MATFNVLAVNRHRLATDGNGVTTLVALAGCPLQCEYCINNDILHGKKPVACTPAKLLEKAMIDYCYFTATGGGITFGGGEPLLHCEALAEFIDIKPADVAVIIETSLNHDADMIEQVLEGADELIIDVKSMNPEIYRKYTGLDNTNTLRWLRFIVDHQLQDKCTIRIPNIPNYINAEEVEASVKVVRDMGFNKINVFDYIIR